MAEKVKEAPKKLDTAEVIETLQAQLKSHKELAEHHNTMYIKAQGALEVLAQLEESNVDKD